MAKFGSIIAQGILDAGTFVKPSWWFIDTRHSVALHAELYIITQVVRVKVFMERNFVQLVRQLRGKNPPHRGTIPFWLYIVPKMVLFPDGVSFQLFSFSSYWTKHFVDYIGKISCNDNMPNLVEIFNFIGFAKYHNHRRQGRINSHMTEGVQIFLGGGALVYYQRADWTLFIFCHCFPSWFSHFKSSL